MIIEDWEILDNQNKHIIDIFNFSIPEEFSNTIKEYNTFIVSKQIKSILKTLSLIDLSIDNVSINYAKNESLKYIGTN